MSYHLGVDPPHEKISYLMAHDTQNFLLRGEGCLSGHPLPHQKIFCLLSHVKISCLTRKSHVLLLWGGPPSRENLLSPVPWENLMCHEKISCLMRHEIFSWGGGCWREHHPSVGEIILSNVSWENLMSHEKISCLTRKSHVSQDFLLGFMEKAWGMRISHETQNFLMRQETGEFLVGGRTQN